MAPAVDAEREVGAESVLGAAGVELETSAGPAEQPVVEYAGKIGRAEIGPGVVRAAGSERAAVVGRVERATVE